MGVQNTPGKERARREDQSEYLLFVFPSAFLLFSLVRIYSAFFGGHGEQEAGKPHYDSKRPHVAEVRWPGIGLGHASSCRHGQPGWYVAG